MKILIRLLFVFSVLVLTSCGKKKCATCPDWGKANTSVETVEEA